MNLGKLSGYLADTTPARLCIVSEMTMRVLVLPAEFCAGCLRLRVPCVLCGIGVAFRQIGQDLGAQSLHVPETALAYHVFGQSRRNRSTRFVQAAEVGVKCR